MKLVEEIFQKNLHFLDTMFPPSQEQGLYGLIIKEQVFCIISVFNNKLSGRRSCYITLTLLFNGVKIFVIKDLTMEMVHMMMTVTRHTQSEASS